MRKKRAFYFSGYFTSTTILCALFIILGISNRGKAQSFRQNFKQGSLLLETPDINTDERMVDTAIKAFLACYQEQPDNSNVCYNLAHLYIMTAMHKAAALPYAEKSVLHVVKKWEPDDPTEKNAPPMAYYYLARAQAVNYQFDNAIDNFTKFKQMLRPNDSRPPELAYWIACCNSGKDLMQSPVDCKVVNLGDVVNSVKDDYSPLLVADETALYFTSNRPSSENTNNGEDIWMTNSAPIRKPWGEPSDPGVPLNTVGGNSSGVSISPDGQTMIIYQSNSTANGTLYISNLRGATWSKPGAIDSNSAGVIDDKGSFFYTPSACFSPDGTTLIFSSNRAGGQGGLDLYSTVRGADGKWGAAVNLGTSINTKYDEDAPFISDDGTILFFSSKGHNTMGGYDVFMSKGSNGAWGDAQNLGYPVNTPDDDKYFVLSPDGKRGYYNTLRLGSIGERDIYEVTFNTPLPTQPIAVLVGYVRTKDGSPLPGDAKVTVTTGSTSVSRPINTTTGKFLQLMVPLKSATIVINAGGKDQNTYVYTPPMDSSYNTLGRAFFLGRITLGDLQDVFNNPTPGPGGKQVASTGEPYFVKYFGYNLDNVSEKDPDFGTLINAIKTQAAKGPVTVKIVSSASNVPTTKFGTNDNLSKARAESLSKSIKRKIKDMTNIKIVTESNVTGPQYSHDAQNHTKYEKFQYVKAYINQQ